MAQSQSQFESSQKLIQDQDARTQGQLAPYIGAGQQALGQQSDILGLNGGGAQQSILDSLKNSPLFQSIFGTGQSAILANASATGGLRGGNVQDALSRFGGDTFAQTIQSQLANLGGLSTQGLSAVGTGAGYGSNAVNNIAGLGENLSAGNTAGLTNQGNLALQGGQTRAGGILGRNAVTQQMIQSGVGLAEQLAAAFIPGGAGVAAAAGGSGGGGGIANTLSKFLF
jgi:hypothetical protein